MTCRKIPARLGNYVPIAFYRNDSLTAVTSARRVVGMVAYADASRVSRRTTTGKFLRKLKIAIRTHFKAPTQTCPGGHPLHSTPVSTGKTLCAGAARFNPECMHPKAMHTDVHLLQPMQNHLVESGRSSVKSPPLPHS